MRLNLSSRLYVVSGWRADEFFRGWAKEASGYLMLFTASLQTQVPEFNRRLLFPRVNPANMVRPPFLRFIR